MLTISDTYANGAKLSEIYGLSTDTKPLDVKNASVFYEMDTGKIFLFDEANKKWLEQ